MKKNVKYFGKTAISGLLALSLVLSNGVVSYGEKVKKQETVFANAGADGSVTSTTVSDWLEHSGSQGGEVKDFSDLTEIKNVKGDETFDQAGQDVTWKAEDKDIYYQGTTDKELPVGLKMTYKLDGEEIQPEELLGKSGQLEIHVVYTNKSKQIKKVDGKNTTIYTPFVMVTGMILDQDIYSDVKVDNGKVINEGNNCIVLGYGLPGLAESLQIEDFSEDMADKLTSDFTIEAHVENCELGNTYTYGSSALFNEMDLDDVEELDELEDKIDDLKDAGEELVDGADTLSDGAGTFAEKMGEFEDQVKAYRKDGVKKYVKGVNSLTGAGPELKKGIKAYTSGVNTYVDGVNAYVKGASQIAQGNTALYEATKGLPSQLKTFDEGLTTYTGGVDKLAAKENVTALKSGAKALSDGVTSMNEALTELEASYENNEKIIAALEPLEATSEDVKVAIESLKKVTAGQKAAITKLKEETAKDSQLKQGATALSEGVSTVMDSLSTLSKNSSSLTGASGQLKKSMPDLVANIKKLKEGGETLTASNSQLTKGGKTLKKSSKKINKTMKTLAKGMKKLTSGGKALNKFTNKLVSGTGMLADASQELGQGTEKFAEGIDEFNKKGIVKLTDKYEDDIKPLISRLRATLDAGKEYKNFSGISKNMDGEVKFIIETEAVENE